MIARALSVGCGVGFGVGIGVDVAVGMGVGAGVAAGVGTTTGIDGETFSLQAPVATSITKEKISPTTFKFAFIAHPNRYKADPHSIEDQPCIDDSSTTPPITWMGLLLSSSRV